MTMTKHLSEMTIDEISLVEEGANGEARVVIFKSKFDPQGQSAPGGPPGNSDAAALADQLKEHDMDIESLSKALEDAEAKLAALETRTTDAEAALEDANTIVKAKDAEIADLISKQVVAEPTTEDVVKSLPESVRKMLEDAQSKAKAADEAVAKMRAETESAEAIAKAREIGIGNPDEIGPVLLRVAKGMTTESDVAVIEGVLKAASAQTKTSSLYKAYGTAEAVDGDPETMLKSKADEIARADKSLTAEQAYAKAMDANPALYNAYIAKRRGA